MATWETSSWLDHTNQRWPQVRTNIRRLPQKRTTWTLNKYPVSKINISTLFSLSRIEVNQTDTHLAFLAWRYYPVSDTRGIYFFFFFLPSFFKRIVASLSTCRYVSAWRCVSRIEVIRPIPTPFSRGPQLQLGSASCFQPPPVSNPLLPLSRNHLSIL